jgi:hypothetical protein
MLSRSKNPNDKSIAGKSSNKEEAIYEAKRVVHHGIHLREFQPV